MFDANDWTALGTWVALVGALLALTLQLRQQHALSATQMALSLKDRYNSPDVQLSRRRLATKLLKGEAVLPEDMDGPTLLHTVATLCAKRALDLDLAWTKFGWQTLHWYAALKIHGGELERLRSEWRDPTLLGSLDEFYAKLRRMDARERKQPRQDPTPEDLHRFLESESMVGLVKRDPAATV